MQPRMAKEVIDQAIEDNRKNEWLLYLFCVVFVGVGLWALVYGVLNGEAVSAIAGCVSSSFCFPALKCAQRIRKENYQVRLVELSLSKADTAQEVIDILRDLFERLDRKD